MNAQEMDYLANHDLYHNYLALALAAKKNITIEKALIAVGLRGLKSQNDKPPSNYKRHNHTLDDALKMAQMRREKKTYRDIGNKFGCTDSHVLIILQRFGLFEKGLTQNRRAYR